MSITEQELAAYADGELSGDDAARVEQAVAADPSLAAKVDRHRALRVTLSAHFAPVADQPLPDRLTALLQQDDKVVQLAPLRDARRTGARLPRWSWIAAPALAASLALALFLPRGDGTTAYADPQLAATLDGQLVAQQASNAETRILLSFARSKRHRLPRRARLGFGGAVRRCAGLRRRIPAGRFPAGRSHGEGAGHGGKWRAQCAAGTGRTGAGLAGIGPRRPGSAICRALHARQMLLEGIDQPACSRAKPHVAAPGGAERVRSAWFFRQVQFNQPPLPQIVAHRVDGHVAPANPFAEQIVLGAEIGQPPGQRAEHREFATLGVG
jgi:hypothetical protein